MKKTVKKEIKATVEKALTEVVQNLKISKPSKQTRRSISKVSKALRADLKNEIKKKDINATRPRKNKQVAVDA